MHFRVRKNVIQLIRTNYDQTKKKGTNTTVGTVKLGKPELPAELRRELTPDEINEFETWLKTHYHVSALREELAALSLAETMTLAGNWFEQTEDATAARTTAADVLFQWQALRKLLVKKGLLE